MCIAVYAPLEFRGINFPQDTKGIQYLLRHLQLDQEISRDLLITLSYVQLQSGLITPEMEDVALELPFLEHGWFTHLCSRLLALDRAIWIEHAWVPQPQCEGDWYQKCDLIKATAVRYYLRVITLSDITDLSGRRILQECFWDMAS